MPRRLVTGAGAVVASAGLAAAIASLGVPWATYRIRGTALNDLPVAKQGSVPVFSVPGGHWYLALILLLAGLLAVAAMGTGRAQAVPLTVAPVLGVVTLGVVGWLASGIASRSASIVATGIAQLNVAAETGAGLTLGLLAGPLLGVGAGLVAMGRRPAPRPSEEAPARAG